MLVAAVVNGQARTKQTKRKDDARSLKRRQRPLPPSKNSRCVSSHAFPNYQPKSCSHVSSLSLLCGLMRSNDLASAGQSRRQNLHDLHETTMLCLCTKGGARCMLADQQWGSYIATYTTYNLPKIPLRMVKQAQRLSLRSTILALYGRQSKTQVATVAS